MMREKRDEDNLALGAIGDALKTQLKVICHFKYPEEL